MRTVLAVLTTITTPALTLPAAASAARFDGKTSQRFNVHLRSGASGKITGAKVDWRARCGPKFVFTSATRYRSPFDLSTPQGFRDVGTYTYAIRAPRGARAKVTTNLAGLHVADNVWKGTLKVKVVVRHNGKAIDHCATKRINWTATRR